MRTGNGLSFRLTGAVLFAAALAACDDGDLRPTTAKPETTSGTATQSDRGERRDIEAPEVYDISEAGLWDGRPSLGGIWVAHPDVTDPHRVIIRNTANDTSVVGALFRRERDIPGPRIQASSEAAEALAMLPGAPVNLHVTALVREPATEEPETEEATGEDSDTATVAAEAGTALATDTAAPKEKKFRWPWAKSKDDAAIEGAIKPLETPSDISETTLAPLDESAALWDRDHHPAQTAPERIAALDHAGQIGRFSAKPPIT
ncbi:SPOR domain-containing protein [Sedimentitalea todarodis]|uniref:SPOR domain-containing protein n=2 Tax=Sedimentitalea todarodis TaxID=1631240 RepID=A0ABU3VFG5_9RHOB|nr:SPOR domain-containing protein [Sedimentitalea todarodis]MDU9004927.1 SPOR domain-containing protein [Sedimentitalea todarodis]